MLEWVCSAIPLGRRARRLKDTPRRGLIAVCPDPQHFASATISVCRCSTHRNDARPIVTDDVPHRGPQRLTHTERPETKHSLSGNNTLRMLQLKDCTTGLVEPTPLPEATLRYEASAETIHCRCSTEGLRDYFFAFFLLAFTDSSVITGSPHSRIFQTGISPPGSNGAGFQVNMPWLPERQGPRPFSSP